MNGFRTMLLMLALTSGANGAEDAIAEVNAARASKGLRPFARDEGLSKAAADAADYRASKGITGHTSNDFAFLPSNVSADAAGCAANEPSWGFMACCQWESWERAGAAWVRKGDRLYCHLFVSGGNTSATPTEWPATRRRRR